MLLVPNILNSRLFKVWQICQQLRLISPQMVPFNRGDGRGAAGGTAGGRQGDEVVQL